MATAAPTRPNPTAAARDAVVDQAITAAANKLRMNDLMVGAATAAVVLLGYLTVVVTLDKLFTLPDWVRLLGLVGLLGGLVAVGWFLIVRPMRRRVNPRYVARKIEDTLPDAKNVLINWVDLQDEALPGSVKAAVGTNAAAGMADADVDVATSSKPVVWLGAAAGVLVLVLTVLFLVFSGPQFLSLLQRAVVPFKPAEIASATTITVTEPQGGDVTVNDGQPLTVAVTLGGRLPDPNGPDKARLLVRYSQDSTEVIELPLTQAGRSDEFHADLGRGTILNGFWYRVAAADARTPEYQVTVRTRPMLGDYKAEYQYPAYLKWPNDTEGGTKLKAIRGTTVTLSAKANRPLQSATLTAATVDGARELVRGEVAGDRVKFTFKLKESGTYRIDFKPTGPEVSTATADYPIEVETDAKPVVELVTPKEDEVQLPLNGLLAVDGTAKDDHGIAAMELRFRVVGRDGLAVKPKAFRDGKPLTREQDGTQLTDVPDYKDSVKLDTLTTADGQPLTLTETDVLEYWIAAIDNCTEPAANVGESVRKKVRLLPAVKEPEKKQEQAGKEQERKKDEQKTEAKRDEQLKNEKRPEDQNRNPSKDPEQKPKEQNPEAKDPNASPMDGKGDKTPETPPEGAKNDDGKGTPPPDKELENKAEDLKKEIDKKKEEQKQEGGDARGSGDKSEGTETKPDAGTKPPEDPKGQPNGDGAKGAAEEKAGPKPEDMNKPENQPSQGKDGGRLVDPQRSEDKPPPKDGAKGEDKPVGEEPKSAPKEGSEAGTSKESKEPPQPQTGDPKKPEDGKKDGQAGDARGAEPQPQKGDQQPQEPMNGGGNTEKKTDPNDLGKAKPKGEPERGSTKPEPKKGDGSEKGEPDKNAGGAKGEQPNNPAESKDPPKGGNDPMPKKGAPADAGQEKPKPQDTGDGKNDPAEGKGEGAKPMNGGKEEEKGTAKPSDGKKPDPMKNGGSGEKQPEDPKNPMGNGGKPDDKKLDPKEMEKAVKGLESNDPKEKKDAQDKLDKAMGKENREKIEQMQKDLKGDDPAKRDAAQKQLEQMKKDAEKNAGGQQQPKEPKELTEQEKKDLADAASKLDSKDPKEKKDAQDKLDKAMGKENRDKVEQMQKDLKSENKETREAAEKKLEEMAKNAPKGDKNDPAAKPPELTEAQKKELADAAGKLNSKDDAERKAAEQKLDEAIGKEKRQELQQDLKDLKGDDPAKAEQAKKKLEKQLEDAKTAGQNQNTTEHNDNKLDRQGGGNLKKPGDPLKANLENQLKAKELALDDFKKYQGDKKFLKENNWTDEEYARFLKQQEAAVAKLRDQVAEARVNPPQSGGPATVGRNGFSQVENRGTAGKVDGTGTTGVAPPGFGDALKRFNGEASKQK